MTRPRLRDVAWLFFRVGNTTFGGGNPTIAVLQREFYQRHWLSADRFAIAFGLGRVTPGTNLLAFCAAAGWYILGLTGAITAVMTITIPSSILVIWLTRVYDEGVNHPLARAAISAIIAAAVGTMMGAAVLLVRSELSKSRWLKPLIIAIGAFLLARVFALPPLAVICAAAFVGFFWTEA
ncbi:MAG TPA: chromate transporter [Bryobacteraceae bacterium]